MELRERERTHNGHRTPGTPAARPDHEALGDVARDAIDHVTMIARDSLKIGKLEARRYVEHVREQVAPRVALKGAAAALAGIAVVMGLLAIFLGLATVIGVAWTFAVYCVAFFVGAAAAYGFANEAGKIDEGKEIAKRFPASRMIESRPEHALAEQRMSPTAHRLEIAEARQEAAREVIPAAQRLEMAEARREPEVGPKAEERRPNGG